MQEAEIGVLHVNRVKGEIKTLLVESFMATQGSLSKKATPPFVAIAHTR